MNPSIIDFHFSLRSPYSWLAAHRVEPLLEDLPVTLHWIHTYPRDLENFAVANTSDNKRLGYVLTDVARFAERYGMDFTLPPSVDCDWEKVDAAFRYAHEQGAGPLFAKLASAARFSQGLDLEQDETLRDLAIGAGLDDAALLAAAETRSGAPIVPNDVAAAEQIFGVPSFVYKGQLFWGNDRIEWLVRAITADTDR